MADINLTFINKSNDMNNSSVVIFQQNVAEDFGELAVAWRVIQNAGRLDNHPFHFQYSTDYFISASNVDTHLHAQHNFSYEALDQSGLAVIRAHADKGTVKNGYTFLNNLPFEVVSADVYNDNFLIASVPYIEPQQKAEITLPELEICIAAIDIDVQEGGFLPSDFTADKSNYTTLSLKGVEESAIVYTTDENGKAVFSLEDIETEQATA
jgi:hypothetical protein